MSPERSVKDLSGPYTPVIATSVGFAPTGSVAITESVAVFPKFRPFVGVNLRVALVLVAEDTN